MTRFIALLPAGSGQLEFSSSPLGKGGEGAVFAVSGHSAPGLPPADSLVVKKYYEPNEGQRREKIMQMVKSPPSSDALAWPLAYLADENKNFVGYVMKKLDYSSYRPWSDLAHSKTRRENMPEFSVQYALVAARNLAAAMVSAHNAGAVLGDVNESNIFVGTDSSIMIVDTDSAQITGEDGRVFSCLVGKPEYTAPELTRGKLQDHVRTPASDAYAYGVALFQILTGGAHPTDGRYTGDEDPPGTVEKIRAGIYPSLQGRVSGFEPLERIPARAIPTKVRSLLLSLLSTDPGKRASLNDVVAALDDVTDHASACAQVSTHFYDSRDTSSCPWCEHAKEQIDPWSNDAPVTQTLQHAPAQKVLNNVSFKSNTGEKPKAARRRAVAPPHASPAPTHRASASSQYSPPPPPSSPPPPRSSGPQYITSTPGAPAQSAGQQIPEKIKGKTVLHYPGGTWGVRPSLSSLWGSQSGLALKCLFFEIPDVAKFWVPRSRRHSGLPGVITSFICSLVGVAGVYWLLMFAFGKLNEVAAGMDLVLVTVLFIFFALLVCAAGASLVALALNSYACFKNRGAAPRENIVKQAIRGVLVPFVWGAFPLWFIATVLSLEIANSRA